MKRTFALWAMVIAMASVGNGETWITINEKPVRIKKVTHCDQLGRGSDADICDCCIIKQSIVSGIAPDSAMEVCVKKKQCNFSRSRESRLEDGESLLIKAQKRLKAMTIVNVEKHLNLPSLLPDREFTERDIHEILKSLQQQRYLALPDELFVDYDGIKIAPLNASAKGTFSGQLFSIRYDPYYISANGIKGQRFEPLYILKETTKGTREIDNLYRVAVSNLSKERILTEDRIRGRVAPRSHTIAHISFDDLHFKIKTKGKTRYFSILQTADGQSLYSLLKEFGLFAQEREVDDPEFLQALDNMKHVFERIGFAVSELHQKYNQEENATGLSTARTFTHGDLHSSNIFFDRATDKVTLIDNETFALSLPRPCSGVNDIVELYLLHSVHTIAHKVSPQLVTNLEFGINDVIWHTLWRSLLSGYFAAFGNMSKLEFIQIFEKFRAEFMRGFGNSCLFASPRNFVDQRQLKRIGPSCRREQLKRSDLLKLFGHVFRHQLKKYQGSADQGT